MGKGRATTSTWVRLRWQILERDDFTCRYCGRRAPAVPLEVDHMLAVDNGGTDDPENLVTACWSCNRGKEYTRWFLRSPLGKNGSKTTQMTRLLVGNPMITDAEIIEQTGLAVTAIRPLRHRIQRRLARSAGTS